MVYVTCGWLTNSTGKGACFSFISWLHESTSDILLFYMFPSGVHL